jgi:hypothetical protein
MHVLGTASHQREDAVNELTRVGPILQQNTKDAMESSGALALVKKPFRVQSKSVISGCKSNECRIDIEI